MDIDLALDHRRLTEAGYRTMQQLLLERGYIQGPHREVSMGDRRIRVEVDLLGGEYGGTGQSHRTQKVQDIRVRKARGADLAFDSPVESTLEGTLPGRELGGATDALDPALLEGAGHGSGHRAHVQAQAVAVPA